MPQPGIVQPDPTPINDTLTPKISTAGQAPALAARNGARGAIDGYVATTSLTATKTATPLNKTPQAVTVIGDEQIRDLDHRNLDQALTYSAGVRGQTFGIDFRNDWFQLRGFPAQENGYFLDGLQLFSFNYAYFQLEPFGLERIEVLRGPSSSLYGGGNPGGIVNGVSKLPTFTKFGLVEAGVDNFGNAYAAFDIGNVAGERNEWSTRLVGLGRAGGTQTDFTEFDRAFIAPSITWRPDGATQFTLYGQFTHTETRGQNFLPYQGTVTRAPFGRISTDFFISDPNVDAFNRTQGLAGFQFEHAIDAETTFRQNFRYSQVDVYLRELYGTGYVAGDPTPTSALISRGNFLAHDIAFITNLDTNVEKRFATGFLNHDALLGVDYKHYEQRQSDGFDGAPSIDYLRPVYGPQQPVLSRYAVNRIAFDQLGVYAQDQISFDRWNLLLGGRYDMLNEDQKGRLYGGSFQEKQTGRFTGRAGLLYAFDSGVSPYAAVSSSFAPEIGTNSAGTLFRPETGEQLEVGLKYKHPTLPISANVAVFDLTRQNVPVTDPSNIFLQLQSGQQNSRGVEAQVDVTLAEGFKAIASFTAFDLRVTRDTVAANIGTTPTNIPQRIAALWLDYTIPYGSLRGLGFGAGVRYTGPSFASGDDVYKVPESYVGDLAVHYDYGPFRAAVNLTNFTDEKYVASCSSTSACFYAERRRVSGSLTYRW